MNILILGANGSGKSIYAERLAAKLSVGALYYVATMLPYGEEGQNRVKKHQKQRGFADFITIEQASNVSSIPLSSDATVLLEDVSNLLSNIMFGGDHAGNENAAFEDITVMCKSCRNAVLVSIDGLKPELGHNAETREYIASLNRLNERLAAFADTVIAMNDGTPVYMKGDANALD